VKALLRAILPPRAAARLLRVRRGVDVATAAALGLLFRPLPLRIQVLAKGRFASTGRLDYPGGAIRLVVDAESERPRLDSCIKEPETVAWIERYVRPGDVVFDVGANVGAYSLVADRATGGTAQIYAFEPSFSTYAQLNRNVALNGSQGRIVPLLLALSDVNALVTFHYSSLAPGTALHTLGDAVDQLGQPFRPAFSQPVMTYRMDDLIACFDLPTPNHIKLDVDGLELQVLRGANGALANPALRSVLVEVEPGRPGTAELEALLGAHDFRVEARFPHGSTADSTTNVLFARSMNVAP
jgi:FkbM family methyltransferase